MKTHRHYTAAYNAYAGISHVPEDRAIQFCQGFDTKVSKLAELGVASSKIEKYERLTLDWLHAKSRCLSPMITGGSNFPVARNDKANTMERKRSDDADEYYNQIVEQAKKEKYYAEHPEARPIMAGDEDALERLRQKLESLKSCQEDMVNINKILRKLPIDREALLAILKTEEKVTEILTPDQWYGRIGFERYQLTNNLAEIKRLEKRVKDIAYRKTKKPTDLLINGVRVLENPDTMRLQLFFEGKPESNMIQVLKKNAFKWAPSVGAWQRQLTNAAIYSFNHNILPALKGVIQS